MSANLNHDLFEYVAISYQIRVAFATPINNPRPPIAFKATLTPIGVLATFTFDRIQDQGQHEFFPSDFHSPLAALNSFIRYLGNPAITSYHYNQDSLTHASHRTEDPTRLHTIYRHAFG